MTSTEIRYTQGETFPEAYYRGGERCMERYPGGAYVCTLQTGHDDGRHVASTPDGYICRTWALAEPIVEQPTPRCELDRYKEQVREQAADALARGYGTAQSWDQVLLRMGCEPLTGADAATIDAGDDLDAYKRHLYEVGLAEQAAHGWCDDGTKQVLDRLDLVPPENRFRVRTTITARRDVWVEVSAPDSTEAWQRVDRLDEDDLREGMDSAGYDPHEILGEEWSLTSQDASTSNVERVYEDD